MNRSFTVTEFLHNGPRSKAVALTLFTLAVTGNIVGILAAVQHFPGPFDWQYRMVSGLASQVDNPEGYWHFCLAISFCFALVFPLAGYLAQRLSTPLSGLASYSRKSFQLGSICGFLVGLERGFIYDLSKTFFKAHEVVALIAFFGVFLGILGFSICWFASEWQQKRSTLAIAVLLLICLPFVGAATSQLVIYLKYRHYGWVSPYWRELGRPVYISFAFWQWLASAGAFASMGCLVLLSGSNRKQSEGNLAHPSQRSSVR